VRGITAGVKVQLDAELGEAARGVAKLAGLSLLPCCVPRLPGQAALPGPPRPPDELLLLRVIFRGEKDAVMHHPR
jgi:hypothetical protein